MADGRGRQAPVGLPSPKPLAPRPADVGPTGATGATGVAGVAAAAALATMVVVDDGGGLARCDDPDAQADRAATPTRTAASLPRPAFTNAVKMRKCRKEQGGGDCGPPPPPWAPGWWPPWWRRRQVRERRLVGSASASPPWWIPSGAWASPW